MTIKIMINGFGRIGRLVMRALVETSRKDIEVVAINHPRGISSAYYLYKYDSVHGIATQPITYGDDWIDVGTGKIKMLADRNPENFDLSDIDVVMECSGIYKQREQAEVFIRQGAKKVLVSAPFKPADKTIVYGVNHHTLESSDTIVSNASCTTNCLAPVAKVLDEAFGIVRGFMTTIHAYTGDQNTLDSSHSDNRRARAAGLSIVPTSTGAASAVSLVLPQLKGKMDGVAMRVPTPNVSCVDLKVDLKKSTTAEEINSVMKKASENELKGVLGYENEELVSVDFNQNPNSSVFDATQTMVMDGTSVRVCSWYDNEWGFSLRMLDTALEIMSAE